MNEYEERLLKTFDAQLDALRERQLVAADPEPAATAGPPMSFGAIAEPQATGWRKVGAAVAALVAIVSIVFALSLLRPQSRTQAVGVASPSPTVEKASVVPATSDLGTEPTAHEDAEQETAALAVESEPSDDSPATTSPTPGAVAEAAVAGDESSDAGQADPDPVIAPLVHTVAPGDILSAIADRYNVSMGSIRAANPHIEDWSVLGIGEVLTIDPSIEPANESPPPTPTASAASIQELPAIGSERCVVGVADGDVLNVRQGPNVDSEIVWWLEPEQCGIFVVGEGSQGWLQIRGGERESWIGFAAGNFLVDVDGAGSGRPTPAPTPNATPGGLLCPGPGLVDYLDVFSQPTYGSAVVDMVYGPGCPLRRTGTSQVAEGIEWIPVQRVDGGASGWVDARLVTSPQTGDSGANPTPTPAPTATVQPSAAETVRVTFQLQIDAGLPADIPPLSNFQVSVGDGAALGNLDADGSFFFAGSALPATVQVQAELIDDPYCWWTGAVTVTGPATVPVQVVVFCA